MNEENSDQTEIYYSTKAILCTPYLVDIDVVKRAHLRRGLAFVRQNEPHKAVSDLKIVLDIESSNKQAETALKKCMLQLGEDWVEPVTPVTPDVAFFEKQEVEEFKRKKEVANLT